MLKFIKLNSLRAKMIVIISITVLILLGGSSVLLYNQARNIMQASIFDSAINSANQNSQIISEWLNKNITEIESLAKTEEIKSMDWSVQGKLLKELAQSQDDIEAMMVADIKGDQYRTSGHTGNISHRNYFTEAVETKSTVISQPIMSQYTNKIVVVIDTPIFSNDYQVIGVLGIILELDYLQELVENMKINGYGNGWIIDDQMNTVAHPNEEYLGNQNVFDDTIGVKQIAEEMVQGKNNIATYTLDGIDKQMAYAPIGINGWSIAMTADTEDVLKELTNIRNISLFVGIFGILIGIVITYFIAKYIADPINELTQIIGRLANYDLRFNKKSKAIKYLKRKDEIGQITNALSTMQNNLISLIDKTKNISEQVAASSEELSASGDQVGEAAQEVSSAIQGVASGAEEQSAQIEETKDNITSLIKQISDVGKTSNEMNEAAVDVMSSIEDGNRSIKASIEKVNKVKKESLDVADNINSLGKLSEEIEGIVDIITGIAEQTNLLALNAAIEAARAGEAGRGFSVVADEIRELAEESSNSTEKIGRLIKEIQDSVKNAVIDMKENTDTVDESVNAIEDSGQSFEQINTVSKKLVDLINDISTRAQEMSANSHQVSDAVNQVASVSQEAAGNAEEVAASSEEQGAATEEIISASNELAEMGNQLSETVKQFKI